MIDTEAEAQQKIALSQPRPKPSRRTKIIGAIVALSVLAGLGWGAWYLTHREAEPVPGAGAQGGPRPGGGGRGGRGGAATTVGIAVAERADIPVILDALGTVVPTASVTVRPQVSGVLQKILFKEGQMVKAGQLLATIDPRQFEMALMQASGQRQRNEAQLDSAKVTLQRYRTLLQQDSIARQEVDTQAALVKQLEGTVVGDRAAEGTARINLGYARIVAPISGRVGLRVVDVGNVVSANDASGIVVITQIAPIDVQFAVPQDRVPEIQTLSNQGAILPATALDRTRVNELDTGRFSTLDNQIDTQTGTVRAKARFDNAKSTLFPNQFVNIRLLLRTIKDGVMVPVSALRNGANGDFVYVLNTAERTAALRLVKRGQATVDRVEIISGLQAGETVVTEGADRLKDGAKVTLPGDRPQGAGGGGRNGRGGRRGDAAAPAGAPAAGGAPAAESSAVPVPSASPTAPPVSTPATPATPATAGDAPSEAPRERRRRPPDATAEGDRPSDAPRERRRRAEEPNGAAGAASDAPTGAPRERRTRPAEAPAS